MVSTCFHHARHTGTGIDHTLGVGVSAGSWNAVPGAFDPCGPSSNSIFRATCWWGYWLKLQMLFLRSSNSIVPHLATCNQVRYWLAAGQGTPVPGGPHRYIFRRIRDSDGNDYSKRGWFQDHGPSTLLTPSSTGGFGITGQSSSLKYWWVQGHGQKAFPQVLPGFSKYWRL